ncbi:MAG TPA: isopentenyl phosphate kinase [Anaerolineales bacterium]|nr:isopentenyl phosphate kinase [Anaerolineales bacterium]
MDELIFLKLGGSLITEKAQRYTVRTDKLVSLAQELRQAMTEAPDLRIVLGHGSGSFGHFAFLDHLNPSMFPPSIQARDRSESAYWNGVAEVWYRASQLNRHVMDALHTAGIPSISLAPSAAATTNSGEISVWEIRPLRAALSSGMLPVIFGDIVGDPVLGAKVLSTEALMWHLAEELRPSRILLAGLEESVWADFPRRSTPIARISASNLARVAGSLGASEGPDVTGGMKSKVEEMVQLAQAVPGLRVQIFSGETAGNLRRALGGELLGTTITGD